MARNRINKAARPRLEALEARLAPATRVWDGGGATNLWSDRFNWVGDVAPANNDDLVFPDRNAVGVDPTSLSSTNNIAGLSVNSLLFNDSGYAIGGDAVGLGGGGLTFDDASSPGFNTIGLGLSVSTLRNFTVVQNATDALRITGTISGGGGIIKDGAGSLRLSGNNTFSGQVVVGQGTLTVGSNTALGSTAGNTEVLAGAAVRFAAGTTLNVAEPLRLNGSGVGGGGALQGSPTATWSGTVFLASDTRITGANGFAIPGAVSGPAAADLTIDGDMFFIGTNTYAGFTTIEDGVVSIGASSLGAATSGTRVLAGATLNLPNISSGFTEPLFLNGPGESNLGAVIVAAGSTPVALNSDIVIESDTSINVQTGEQLTLTGSISGNPAATLRKIGNGTLRYAIAATETVTFAGTTLVADGTLVLNTPGRNVIVGPLAIAPASNDTATVRLVGTFSGTTETPGSGNNQIDNNVVVSFQPGGVLNLNNHSDTVGGLNMTGGQVTTGSGTLTLAGNVVSNAKADEPGAQISGRLSLGNSSRTFTVANGVPGADLLIGADILGSSGINLIKEGPGSLVLTGNNTHAGLTIVNNGLLVAASNTALGGSGNTTVNAGGTLRIDGPGPLTISEIIQLNGAGFNDFGALLNTGDNTLTSTINILGNAVINTEAGGTLTHTGNLNNGPAATVTKIGAGALEFTGTPNVLLTGTTRVHQGTLILDKSSTSGPVIGNLVVGDGVSGPATVLLQRANQIGNSSTVTIDNGTLDLGGNAETIAGLDLTAGQVIAILAPLVVNGNVTSRAAANSSVILGALSLGDGAAGTVRTFTVEDGAAGADLVIAGTITDGASSSVGLDKAGPGTLAFNGSLFGDGTTANTYGGATRVLDGTLRLNHANGVAAVPGNLTVGDGVGGPASARVVLFSDDQVPNSATVTVNQDGLFDQNGNDETIATLVLTGGRVETGAGFLTPTSQVRSNAAPVPAEVNGKVQLVSSQTSFDVADEAAVSDDLVVNAVISGAGGLRRTGGTGRLVLPAANTYSGQTFLDHGVVDMRGGSLSNSNVRIQTTDANIFSTVLVGAGTVRSLDVVRGVVTLGGTLTVIEDLDFAPAGVFGLNSVLDIPVNGTGANQFGRIVANGIDLGNATTVLQVRIASGFTPQGGDTFGILTNTSTSLTNGKFKDPQILIGEDAVLDEGETFDAIGAGGGVPFFITYTAGDGNEVAITRNTPATVTDVVFTPTALDEGGVVTFTGRLTDPDANANLFLSVDWGDGSPVETVRPGRNPFSLQHRYRDDNADDEYVIRFTWGDGSGETRSRTQLVLVRNVAPSVDAGDFALVRQGGTFTRLGSFADPGRDTWTAFVDYGDGRGEQRLRVDPASKTFRLEHRYNRPGVYQVTVTVVDDDGGVGRDSFLVVVLPRAGGAPGRFAPAAAGAAQPEWALDAALAALAAEVGGRRRGLFGQP